MTPIEGTSRPSPSARFAIVAPRWNPSIVDALVAGALRTLQANGVAESAIDVLRVPGTWEVAQACAWLARRGGYRALIALGCVVRGDTRHYEHVADGCAQGLMRVALDHGVAVANGVLAVEMHEDALARADGRHGNKGEEAALAALEMASLSERLT